MKYFSTKGILSQLTKSIIRFLLVKLPFVDRLILRLLKKSKKIDYAIERGRIHDLVKALTCYIARCGTFNKPIEKQICFYNDRQSFKMNLDVCDYTQCSYYFGPSNHDLINLLMKGGTTMLDIGANVGMYSLVASQYFSSVYAFEPTPSTLKKLNQNMKLSSVDNVTVYPMGLSDKEGSFNLYENPMNRGGNSLGDFPEEYKKTHAHREWLIHKVNVTTLDHLVPQWDIQTIDLIKIDVEGHEFQVLLGAMQTIQKYHPALFVEVYSIDSYKKLLEILPEGYAGLNATSFDEIDVKLTHWDYEDVIFVSDQSKLDLKDQN